MKNVANGQRPQRIVLPRLDLDCKPATTIDQFVPSIKQLLGQANVTNRAERRPSDQLDIIGHMNNGCASLYQIGVGSRGSKRLQRDRRKRFVIDVRPHRRNVDNPLAIDGRYDRFEYHGTSCD
jgi:hypothetical protein